MTEIAGIAVLLWVLYRQKTVQSGWRNLITILLLLFIPIVVALAMRSLSVLVVSTIIWQFIFSGFGEEFTFRGYFQPRLNQAFGRPLNLFGIQFGIGLIIASLLFGLWQAFHTYDPAVGVSSFAWGWALSTISMTGSKKMRIVMWKPNNQEDLAILEALFNAGKVVPVIDKRYPLSEIPEALRYLEEGHARGKVVITLNHNNKT